jgi:catabolite regulation protein CreA
VLAEIAGQGEVGDVGAVLGLVDDDDVAVAGLDKDGDRMVVSLEADGEDTVAVEGGVETVGLNEDASLAAALSGPSRFHRQERARAEGEPAWRRRSSELLSGCEQSW